MRDVKNLRVAVIDDEKPARGRILELLAKQSDVQIAWVAGDGQEALQLIRSAAPAILFLDIQMPGINGLEILREVPREQMPLTIFVTGYDKYAITAFDAQALDYLLKPFSDERFEAALQRARNHSYNQSFKMPESHNRDLFQTQSAQPERDQYFERIVIKAGGRVIFLDVTDIDWIEAAGVYVYLHSGPKAYLHRATIGQLAERLNPKRFVRIHRSTIVNTSRIVELQARTHGDYVVLLKGGVELTLSRGYRAELEGWLRQAI